MPRARLLKPDFYDDEKLNAMPLGPRLVYPGLWQLADREGRLEDRPAKIAAYLFPPIGNERLQSQARKSVPAWLDLFAEAGMIVRYVADGKAYIAIPTFLRHQHPHQNEPASIIPAPAQSALSLIGERTSDNGRRPRAKVRSTPAKAESETKAKAETESETKAESESSLPAFVPNLEPSVPDEPGFVGEYVRHFERLNGKHPSASAVADAAQIEREYGYDACMQVAKDLAWSKPPNYMTFKLEERRNGKSGQAHRVSAGRRGRADGPESVIAGWEAYANGEG